MNTLSPSKDSLGRPLRTLRVSVTDRCTLRCRYCMPAEIFGDYYKFSPRSEILTFEEIIRLVSAFIDLGVQHVKFTGGEPLLRKELPKLIQGIRSLDSSLELSMTSNGILLAKAAESLMEAGLDRVNVSLDSLDAEIASAISGRKFDPEAIWDTIIKVRDMGLPVKVNSVIQRGLNESQIVPLAERCRQSSITLRFIEYMDVGTRNNWDRDTVVSGPEVHEILNQEWPLVPLPALQSGSTSTSYAYKDGNGEVGFINSITMPFCRGCDRARLSAEGSLYTCLFSESGVSLKDWLREEQLSDSSLRQRLQLLWGNRSDRYSEARMENSSQDESSRPEMWTIGG